MATWTSCSRSVRPVYALWAKSNYRAREACGGEAEGGFGLVIPRHDGTLDEFFESVWDVYGDKTGIQLSNMTHSQGEPWTIVAEQYGFDLSQKPSIPPEIIEAVFEQKVANASI